MAWIENLLFSNSIAHVVILYAFVIAVGIALGKIKFFGISLGVTFVLFTGLLVSHFGFTADHQILDFLKEFGLILFVFSIGLQVGPGFFSSFKRGGILLNMLAVSIVVLNILVVLTIYWLAQGRVEMPMLVGILSGAVTNTPGLGAAQQALEQLQAGGQMAEVPQIALGYAVAYPLGVIGLIMGMLMIRFVMKVKLDEENRQVEEVHDTSAAAPSLISFKVENPLIFGKTVAEISQLIDRKFVMSRIMKNGEVSVPDNDTTLEKDDLLYVALSQSDKHVLRSIIGSTVDMTWDIDHGPVVSRRIVVTKSKYNGKTLGSLRLRSVFHLNATRVNRSGVDLLASPNLVLQVGDRLTVVGKIEDLNLVGERLGNSMKRLNEPNMITLFVGIFLGIVVGSIPVAFPGMPMPVKLGLAGGPLVVAILIGRFGYKLKLVTYTSTSASLMLREIGICLFLASVGLMSGGNFVKTVVSGDGLLWVMWGVLITVIPVLIVGFIGRVKYKLNYFTLMGLIAGSNTDPPALAYSNKVANNDAPAVAYSTVYPLVMFLRVLSAQMLILAFA